MQFKVRPSTGLMNCPKRSVFGRLLPASQMDRWRATDRSPHSRDCRDTLVLLARRSQNYREIRRYLGIEWSMPHCKSHPETAIACENKNDGYAMKALPSQETGSSKPIIGKASLEGRIWR